MDGVERTESPNQVESFFPSVAELVNALICNDKYNVCYYFFIFEKITIILLIDAQSTRYGLVMFTETTIIIYSNTGNEQRAIFMWLIYI
jgi:hypothetical protein